jgi:hypothetical protein
MLWCALRFAFFSEPRNPKLALDFSERRLIQSFLLSVALLAALSCAGCEAVPPVQTGPSTVDPPSAMPTPPDELRDLTIAEKATLAEGFTAGLDNPDSAKFRWTKVPKRMIAHSFDYCALIAVKKADGSAPGMKPFLATITTEGGNITGGAIAALSGDDREENREVIPKLCRQKRLNPFDAK